MVEEVQLDREELDEIILGKQNKERLMEEVEKYLDENFDLISEGMIKKMKVQVDLVKDCKKYGSIGGGHSTLIAMKNHNSFLVESRGKEIILVENGKKLYSSKLPFPELSVYDLIYVPFKNCYFFDYDRTLYRKDINKKPFYFFMDCACGNKIGACFQYSTLHKRLLINRESQEISVINLATKEIEIQVNHFFGNEGYYIANSILDFKLFGEQENKVVFGTVCGGFLKLLKLNYQQKKGSVVESVPVGLIEQRKEILHSLSVCEKNQYVFVELGIMESFSIMRSSRIMIWKLSGDRLTKQATVDQFVEGLKKTYVIHCFGYFGSHILWISPVSDINGVLQVFYFNIETREFKELKEKRHCHQVDYPAHLYRRDDKFYYIGNCGNFMSLRITF